MSGIFQKFELLKYQKLREAESLQAPRNLKETHLADF